MSAGSAVPGLSRFACNSFNVAMPVQFDFDQHPRKSAIRTVFQSVLTCSKFACAVGTFCQPLHGSDCKMNQQ